MGLGGWTRLRGGGAWASEGVVALHPETRSPVALGALVYTLLKRHAGSTRCARDDTSRERGRDREGDGRRETGDGRWETGDGRQDERHRARQCDNNHGLKS